HALFEAQVRKHGAAPAVIYEEHTLSYRQLNRRANRLARYLMARGVGPDTPVGLCMTRSPEMLVAILAILKAGGAYVPLDPQAPPARLAALLDDTGMAIVLTQGHLQVSTGLPETLALCVDDDHLQQTLADYPCTNLSKADKARRGQRGDNLAYIIYTSGSTGTPKGVMIEHRAAVNYAVQIAQRYFQGEVDGSIVSSPLAFDLALTGVLPPLVAGKSLHLLPQDDNEILHLYRLLQAPAADTPAVLPSEVSKSEVSKSEALTSQTVKPDVVKPQAIKPKVVKLTPSHLDALGQLHGDKGVLSEVAHRVIVGGEALPGRQARALAQWLPNGLYVNHYGPTETTIGCVTCDFERDTAALADWVSVPIGRPLPRVEVYVVDRFGQLAAPGVVGELWVGGAGVARGYWQRAALSEARFIRNPFSDDPHSRVYRTGDRVRWLADGTLAFVGRVDQQVKLRGFRIEPGEIESQLLALPAVNQAAVVLHGGAGPCAEEKGEGRLIAYVSLLRPDALTAAALRETLAAHLPAYMMPSQFVIMASLPLTANNKVDRSALPDPDAHALQAETYEAPVGEIEQVLADIWQALLGVARVGRR
ncbi:amino acid adenylation domain-containing protein, partial [Exilibacterium tricleocarpae]